MSGIRGKAPSVLPDTATSGRKIFIHRGKTHFSDDFQRASEKMLLLKNITSVLLLRGVALAPFVCLVAMGNAVLKAPVPSV